MAFKTIGYMNLKKRNEIDEIEKNLENTLNQNIFDVSFESLQEIERLYNNYQKLMEETALNNEKEDIIDRFKLKIFAYKTNLMKNFPDNNIDSYIKIIEKIDSKYSMCYQQNEYDSELIFQSYETEVAPFVVVIYFYLCSKLHVEKKYNVLLHYSKYLINIYNNHIEIVKRILSDKRIGNIYYFIAQAYFYTNDDINITMQYFDKAIKTDSQFPYFTIKKAVALTKYKKYDEAKVIYLELLTRENLNLKYLKIIYKNLFYLCIKMKQKREAKKYFKQINDLFYNNQLNQDDLKYIQTKVFALDKNYEKAIKELTQLESKNTDNEKIYLNIGTYYFKKKEKEIDKSYEYIKKGLSIYLKKICQNSNIPEHLFIYRPIDENNKKAIEQGLLYFSAPCSFNDPLDSQLCFKVVKKRELKNVLKRIRIRCFSGGYYQNEPNNTLMWSHYAKNHTGMAVEYEFSKNLLDMLNNNFFFKKVYYQNTIIDNMEIMENIDYMKSFYTKDPLWEYENEYRLITFDDKLIDGNKLINSINIKSITFGYRTKKKDKLEIIELAQKANPQCEFFAILTPNIEKLPFELIRKKIN